MRWGLEEAQSKSAGRLTGTGSEVWYIRVKNMGLGFAIPYFHNGQAHDYVPDFLVLVNKDRPDPSCLILETKGFDPLEAVKCGRPVRALAVCCGSQAVPGGRMSEYRD